MAAPVGEGLIQEGRDYRWPRRRAAASVVRAAIVLLPIAAGVGASVVVGRLLGPPRGPLHTALFWFTLIAVPVAVVVAVDRAARRLLPLAVLLRLSMVFPDKAPSRLGIALRAGTVRRLEARVAAVQAEGVDDEPGQAARQIIELAAMLAGHDRATRGHSERVRALTDLVGQQLGLDPDDADRLRWSALLHDVGKLTVDSHVLNKTEPLDDADWEVLRRHPEDGARLARPLHAWLGPWADTIEQHHERWDGSGYPKRLRGEAVCLGARIVAVTDAFDVMTAARSYKRPVTPAVAREELAACAGRDFDPDVVRAFLQISLGRLRWALGLGGLFALPWSQIPQAIGGSVAATAAAGIGVVTALGTGLVPLHAPPPDTQVLGEAFRRPAVERQVPVDGVVTPIDDSASVETPAGPAPSTTATTAGRRRASTTTAPHRPDGPPPSTTAPPPPAPVLLVAVADTATTGPQNPVRIPVLDNDTGPYVRHTLRIAVPPAHGHANTDSDGHAHYAPDLGFTGVDAFSYRVCTAAGQCAVGFVTVVVG